MLVRPRNSWNVSPFLRYLPIIIPTYLRPVSGGPNAEAHICGPPTPHASARRILSARLRPGSSAPSSAAHPSGPAAEATECKAAERRIGRGRRKRRRVARL